MYVQFENLYNSKVIVSVNFIMYFEGAQRLPKKSISHILGSNTQNVAKLGKMGKSK